MKYDETVTGAEVAPRILLVCAVVQLWLDAGPVELRRGMEVWVSAESLVGTVAAIVLDARTHEPTHILVGHIPPTAIYRQIPLHLVSACDGESVWLNTTIDPLDTFPDYQLG